MNKTSVFIATSIDGYIADKNGGINWLHSTPNPENNDMGYSNFIKEIDAIIMGRNTFTTIQDFDIDWPYTIPVFVLSNHLKEIPENLKSKVSIVKGSLKEIIFQINQNGYRKLYIDGGKTISSFLKEDLIDELILTTIPVVLGGGSLLFSELPIALNFELVSSKIYLNQVVQNQYKRMLEK